MNTNDLSTLELYDRYVMPTYSRFPMVLDHGRGCRVWDAGGGEYLDFGAGIAVCALGHSHPEVAEVISLQSKRLMHTSNLYHIHEQGELARKLVECTGHGGKVFFCNSGAEANEGLYKVARKFGTAVAGEGKKYEVITFEGSFHGRTLAGLSATGQAKVKAGFAPMVDGFRTVPFHDMDAVRAVTTDKTAAILVEPVIGEGGIHLARKEFLRDLRAHCDANGLLLFFDEVQCGLGRTGDWCGWKSLGAGDVVPDGISWAKGIAGGFPLGAFWAGEKVVRALDGEESRLCDLLGPGSHGTTYGGNPLASAVASKVIDVIERDGLLQRAKELGGLILERLRELDPVMIEEVRGVGLMIGIQLSSAYAETAGLDAGSTPALDLVRRLNKNHLLTIPAGASVVRWLPPLNVVQSEVDEAVGILEMTLNEVKS